MFVMKISEGHSKCFTKYHHANIYFFKANKGSKKAMCEIKVTDVALMSSCLCWAHCFGVPSVKCEPVNADQG